MERIVECVVDVVPGSVPGHGEGLRVHRLAPPQVTVRVQEEQVPSAGGRSHAQQALCRGRLPGSYVGSALALRLCLAVAFGNLQLELLLALPEVIFPALLGAFALLLPLEGLLPFRCLPAVQE
ncbi:hypothetical protein [Streptomyces erythrochromogenes]|uniref:hypothetical protein n=1 Tax=Streptomyces erythrochromogenes TaxID=285574 RepID=UPI0036ACF6FD